MTTEITHLTACIRTDLFLATQYEMRPGNRGTVIGLQLNSHFVFKWIFDEAWAHFIASIATVNRYTFHTSEAIFNDSKRWAELGKSTRIAIGRCLAYFVRKGMLPLFCVNPHANNKLYMVHVK